MFGVSADRGRAGHVRLADHLGRGQLAAGNGAVGSAHPAGLRRTARHRGKT